MIKLLALVAAGGAVGSVLRFLVSLATVRLGGVHLPWATLSVNVVGCIAIGVLAGYFVVKGTSPNPEFRALFMIGLLGAFTTFSTFSWEVIDLWRGGNFRSAIAIVVASNSLGLLGSAAGFAGVRAFVGAQV